MPSLDYFRDGEHFLVAVDRGAGGIWERRGLEAGVPWAFVVPGSLRWDALRQDLYRAGHDFDRSEEALVASLPPLPPAPMFARLSWKDNFPRADSLLGGEFPALAGRLHEGPNPASFWFVLHEDLWETYYGDGTFQYFSGEVFADAEAARRRYARELEECVVREAPYKDRPAIVVKELGIGLDGDRLLLFGGEPKWPEDYALEKVVERIEALLKLPVPRRG